MRKYTEEFINSSEILKKAVCGFEFEFYLKELSFYRTLEELRSGIAKFYDESSNVWLVYLFLSKNITRTLLMVNIT